MNVPTGNAREARRWLASAKRDLETARWNREGEFYNTACFQAQQAVDQVLKAFLLAQGERNVRGHSTLELLERSIAFDPKLTHVKPDCRVLDRHYIPTRYPDALPDGSPHDAFGPEDADDAIKRSERIMIAVEPQIYADESTAPAGPDGG